MNRARRGATAHAAGLAAEDAVARIYASRGYAVLARRWRGGGGEIDLIVRGADCLIFVEVKARKGRMEDDPVSPAQWRRLAAAAEAYCAATNLGETVLRFDLAVVGAGGVVEVFENVAPG